MCPCIYQEICQKIQLKQQGIEQRVIDDDSHISSDIQDVDKKYTSFYIRQHIKHG